MSSTIKSQADSSGGVGVYESFAHLESMLIKCTTCCEGKSKSYHCPLCPSAMFKPANLFKARQHLAVHWKRRILAPNRLTAVNCNLPHSSRTKLSHYHCPVCGVVVVRKFRFLSHLQTVCQYKCAPDLAANIASTPDPIRRSQAIKRRLKTSVARLKDQEQAAVRRVLAVASAPPPTVQRINCDVCGKPVSRKWMKSHLAQHARVVKHDISFARHHHSSVVDARRGLYASAVSVRGRCAPIHVRKVTTGPNAGIVCEFQTCVAEQEKAQRAGNSSYECPHARSLTYAVQAVEHPLAPEPLDNLVAMAMITPEQAADARRLQEEAVIADSPLLVFLPNPPLSRSVSLYVSVYAREARHWARLGRTVVTYDRPLRRVSCRCARVHHTCVHKVVGYWFLFQEMPTELLGVPDGEESATVEEGDEMFVMLGGVAGVGAMKLEGAENNDSTENNEAATAVAKAAEKQAALERNIRRQLEHIQAFKRYPADAGSVGGGPGGAGRSGGLLGTLPVRVAPSETTCNVCAVFLSAPKIVSVSARVVLRHKIIKGVEVYNKTCLGCGTPYRYQDWTDGIHNYNNSLFLGIDVCLFIRAGIQNQVSISQSVAILSDVLQEKLLLADMVAAYLTFECLTDHAYSYYCILCGHHPTILILDSIREMHFKHAVSTGECSTQAASDTVDVVQFWSEVERGIICQGLDTELSVALTPEAHSDHWSMWVGEHTRASPLLHNSEHRKCLALDSMTYDPNACVPDEFLADLRNEKVKLVRRFCEELGISSVGTKLELILRVHQHTVPLALFDAAHERIFGVSGGWLVGVCPHSVVYSAKCLLRSCSSTDYVDVLRSMRHRPNVCVADLGRTITSAQEKVLAELYGGAAPVALPPPYCAEYSAAVPDCDCAADSLTGVVAEHSCVDWFHHANLRAPAEALRRSALVPGLAEVIDTPRIVTRFLESLRTDLSYLTDLSPARHLFLSRLLFHLHNEAINARLRCSQSAATPHPLVYNEVGQVCHGPPARADDEFGAQLGGSAPRAK